jgi:hypothetical protein
MPLTISNTTIESSYDGQVIENLDIYVEDGYGLEITHDNVIVRNVRIHHETGAGILVQDASNVQILNSEIINADPPRGQDPETSDEVMNIEVIRAAGLKIQNVTLRDGATGIHLYESPGAQISHVDGYNFHGPFPRGQFVQFNNSGDSTLTGFYVYNDPANSHPEDNISVYDSPNVEISDGVIDGNNSASGVGIMFENDSTGGHVTGVDVIHMGNGAFSSYADDVVYDTTRTFDSIWLDQGRGESLSNGLHWNHSASGVRILNSTYTNPGNPENISWGSSAAGMRDIQQDADAAPMARITNDFDWLI